MRGLLLASVLLLAASAAAGQTLPETGSKRGQEVVATVAKWAEAVRDRDARALDAIFDDDVIITTHDGRVRGKAEEMEAMKPNPNMRTTAVANDDVALKLFGDVAVVTAVTRMKTVIGNARESIVSLRYTAVFVKKDGSWRIVALQTGRAAQTGAF